MNEKRYLILLDVDARKRHYHTLEGGKIVQFMVQLEVRIGQIWKEVVRYDCAHDYVHKDCYNIKGKRRKMRLSLEYQEALTFADEDINQNWQTYRQRFLRGDVP
jgi:hypothetical protein